MAVNKKAIRDVVSGGLLRADMRKIFAAAMKDSKKNIQILQINQFVAGQDAEGNKLPDYSEVSVRDYGKPAGPWKLYDQGDFYKGVYAKPGLDETEVSSKDSKTEMLRKKVRKGNSTGNAGEIFGLTDKSKESLAEHLLGFLDEGPLTKRYKEKVLRNGV